MTTAPILGFPDLNDKNESFELIIDSSKLAHAAVLTQCPDGKHRRIISYFSKSIPIHMQKYGGSRLETLGLLAALKHYKMYLLGSYFVVKTDCKALLNLQTIFSREGAYMQRRMSMLSGFHFKIEHISGQSEEIQISDYLRRYGPFTTKPKMFRLRLIMR